MKAFVLAMTTTVVAAAFSAASASALTYGAGTYGSCQYGTCTITISVPASIDLSVTPAGGGAKCTVANGDATVSTGSSTGYTLTLSTTSAQTALNDAAHGTSIAASSGTASSPTVLSANRWGYRLDSGAFGSGPTSPLSNGSTPSLAFAGVPAASAPASIHSQTSSADSVVTSVWYGVCADMSQAAGSYTNDVIYSAIIN